MACRPNPAFCLFLSSCSRTQLHSFIYMLPMSAFILLWKNWQNCDRDLWPTKPKICTIRTYRKKFVSPSSWLLFLESSSLGHQSLYLGCAKFRLSFKICIYFSIFEQVTHVYGVKFNRYKGMYSGKSASLWLLVLHCYLFLAVFF